MHWWSQNRSKKGSVLPPIPSHLPDGSNPSRNKSQMGSTGAGCGASASSRLNGLALAPPPSPADPILDLFRLALSVLRLDFGNLGQWDWALPLASTPLRTFCVAARGVSTPERPSCEADLSLPLKVGEAPLFLAFGNSPTIEFLDWAFSGCIYFSSPFRVVLYAFLILIIFIAANYICIYLFPSFYICMVLLLYCFDYFNFYKCPFNQISGIKI